MYFEEVLENSPAREGSSSLPDKKLLGFQVLLSETLLVQQRINLLRTILVPLNKNVLDPNIKGCVFLDMLKLIS